MSRHWLPVWCVVAALAFVGGFAHAGDTPWGGGGGGGGGGLSAAAGAGTANAIPKFDVSSNKVKDSCIADDSGTVTATCSGNFTLVNAEPGVIAKNSTYQRTVDGFAAYFAGQDSAGNNAFFIGDVSAANKRIDVSMFDSSQSFTASQGNGTPLFSVDYNGNTALGDDTADVHTIKGLPKVYTANSTAASVANGMIVDTTGSVAKLVFTTSTGTQFQAAVAGVSDGTLELHTNGGGNGVKFYGGGTQMPISINGTGISNQTNTNNGQVYLADGVRFGPRNTTTIADNGGGTAATATFTHQRDAMIYPYTCSDANGCELSFAETDAGASAIGAGSRVEIINIGTNTLTLKYSAGVAQLPGAADVALGQYDNIALTYLESTWIATTNAVNN